MHIYFSWLITVKLSFRMALSAYVPTSKGYYVLTFLSMFDIIQLLRGIKWYLVLILTFLKAHEFEDLFICLALRVSYSVNSLFQFFDHFLLWLLPFLFDFQEFLVYFRYQVLQILNSENSFFQYNIYILTLKCL